MDFISGLPRSKGKEVIFVVVGRLTKFAHFMSLTHPYTALTVAQKFIKECILYMVFLNPLSLTKIGVSLATFGKNFSSWLAHNLSIVQYITPERMDKQRG